MGYIKRDPDGSKELDEMLRGFSRDCETVSIVNPEAYRKMVESIDLIRGIFIEAMKTLEYEDEECGAEFRIVPPSHPYGDSFRFTIILPDYGVILDTADLSQMTESLPQGTTVEISPYPNGEKVRIDIIYRGIMHTIT